MEGRDHENKSSDLNCDNENDNIAPVDDPNDLLTLDEIVQKNVSKNIRDLRGFLSSNGFITEKGDAKSNIINASEKKTYHIPDVHLEEFFARLDACRKESRMIHFLEKQEFTGQTRTGIVIDFDRYQKVKEPQINEKHFENLTRHLARLLNELVDFKDFSTNGIYTFHIFYIRKPAITVVQTPSTSPCAPDTPKYKDGFHILIPEVQMSRGFKKFFIQEIINRGIMKSTFRDIDLLEEPEKMLDKMSASFPVCLLGNSKPDKPAYKLTHAWEIDIYTEEDNEIDRRKIDIGPLLDGAVKMSRDGEPIPINLTYELSLSAYMQTFNGRPTWLRKHQMNYKQHLETKIQLLVEKTSHEILSEDEIQKDDEDLSVIRLNNARADHIRQLLEILDISYATDYEKWFKVMCAIAHCGISEDYKKLARAFSKRDPAKYSPAEFERVWSEAASSRFDRRPVTLRSILHWARESSRERFEDVKSRYYGEILRRTAYDNEGRVEQSSVARICHAMCGEKFVVDVGHNEKTGRVGYCWYEFVTPDQAMRKGEVYKWRKELEPDNIHLFIGTHLPKVYRPVKESIKDKKDNPENEAIGKYWAGVERNFRLYMSKLENDTFQNGIVRQCQYTFRQRGFYEELDSYEDIIGVGNGVLKLGIEPQLIKGFHEYKISKFTETDYVPFNPENPQTKTLLKAFHDIFPEQDVFEYMMMHASTGLDYRESACILTLLVGGGQNGKTFFAKMVHNTLGNMYCASGKPTLLTAPMERGESANSAQMQQKDKRWFYIDEFNKCEWLNPARVKSMVTPGWQSGRDLHARQGNFKNTSNPLCLSNFDFIIDTTDHGTWRRIYYYRNKVKFTSAPDRNNPYERLEDSRFIDEYTNDPAYKQAMLSIMVHFYSKLCREYRGDLKKVPVPTIDRETEEFRNRQDTLNRFITQMMVKSPDAEDIGLPSLATRYIDWYNRNIKPSLQMSVDVQSQFENSRLAPYLTRKLGGILFVSGFRIKREPEEQLLPGEEELTVAQTTRGAGPIVQLNTVQLNTVQSTLADAEDHQNIDAFLAETIQNAPTHIQHRADERASERANDMIQTISDGIKNMLI